MTLIRHECDCGTVTIVNKNQKLIAGQEETSNTFMGKINEGVEYYETVIDPKHCRGCKKLLKV